MEAVILQWLAHSWSWVRFHIEAELKNWHDISGWLKSKPCTRKKDLGSEHSCCDIEHHPVSVTSYVKYVCWHHILNTHKNMVSVLCFFVYLHTFCSILQKIAYSKHHSRPVGSLPFQIYVFLCYFTQHVDYLFVIVVY